MLQFMRGTSTAVSSSNPTLKAGQPFYETDSHKLKIGDGSTAWNSLPYIGSSKVYNSVVIGSSNAGYTENQVDYLCNGVNDQIQFQNAINSIDNGTIYILGGDYYLSDGINSGDQFDGYKPISLIGAGIDSTILHISNNSSNGIAFFKFCSSFTVQGDESTSGYGLIQMSDSTVDHISITGCDTAVLVRGSNNTITNCNISNWSINGVEIHTGCSNIKVVNNTFQENQTSYTSGANYAIQSSSGNSRIFIQNNMFDIRVGSAGSLAGDYYVVSGNNIQSYSHGFYSNQCDRSIFTGNFIQCIRPSSDYNAAIRAITGACNYSTITGNIFVNFPVAIYLESNGNSTVVGNCSTSPDLTLKGDFKLVDTSNLCVGNITTGQINSGTSANNLQNVT